MRQEMSVSVHGDLNIGVSLLWQLGRTTTVEIQRHLPHGRVNAVSTTIGYLVTKGFVAKETASREHIQCVQIGEGDYRLKTQGEVLWNHSRGFVLGSER